ncbi:MAG: FecR family protein, partial [Defluviitaleaceae bacterium]|nr:FecR family protein [Defluviitaleaceae bacterium]
MYKKLITCIVIIALLMYPLSAFAGAVVSDVGESPRVTAMRGNVQIFKAGGHSPATVYVGMIIADGDEIITGTDSSVTINYFGQQIVTGELTRISVNSIWQRHGRGHSSVSLVEGMIKVRVDIQLDNNSRNSVRAANSIVGVRGTEYVLIYSRMGVENYGDEASFTRLLVIEGEVRFDVHSEDDSGDVETFVISPLGLVRITENLQGEREYFEIEHTPEAFAVALETLDLTILEILRDDPRAIEINPELFAHIDDIIEQRIAENDERAMRQTSRPDNQIIFGSEAGEVLPTLPHPSTVPPVAPPAEQPAAPPAAPPVAPPVAPPAAPPAAQPAAPPAAPPDAPP